MRLLLPHVLRSLGCREPLQVLLPQLRPGGFLLRPADLGSQVFRAFLLRPGETGVVHLPLLDEPEELLLPLVEERFRRPASRPCLVPVLLVRLDEVEDLAVPQVPADLPGVGTGLEEDRLPQGREQAGDRGMEPAVVADLVACLRVAHLSCRRHRLLPVRLGVFVEYLLRLVHVDAEIEVLPDEMIHDRIGDR